MTALVIPARAAGACSATTRAPVGDRLDLLAVQYLNDPTGFWRLCDANNAMVAGALAARAADRHPGGGALR